MERAAHHRPLAQLPQGIQDVRHALDYRGGISRLQAAVGLRQVPSVHFSAQIASFTLTMMQYNILCTVKRFEAYETIGALFRETTGNTLELSAADRIWELILDTILEIAEFISADASELLSAVIDGNPKFHKLYQMYKLVE